MTVIQEVQLNMYRALLKFFSKFAAVIAAVPALALAVAELKTLVAAIEATLLQQTRDAKGVTVSKEQSANALISLALGVAGSVSAWALEMNNEALRQDMRKTPTKLRRLRGGGLAPVCARIYEEAKKNLPALAPFNVTDAQLDALQQAIAAYTESIAGPRSARAEKTTTVADLQRLFRQANLLIKEKIDPLMRSLIVANPSLGTEFAANRSIINIGGTSTQLKIVVTNADSKPVKGATLGINVLGITALTNSRGRVLVRPIAPGTYTIELKATGYLPQLLDEARVVQGKVNTVAIVLQPE